MAIAISSSRADSASVPGVAFKCLNQDQCSDWLEAFKSKTSELSMAKSCDSGFFCN